MALAAKRFTDTQRAVVEAEFLGSAAAFRRGDGYAVPGTFVTVAGRVPAR